MMIRQIIVLLTFFAFWLLSAQVLFAQGRILMVDNANDSGSGSLRWAIEEANARPGMDTIFFELGPNSEFYIQPLTPFPSIFSDVIIWNDLTTAEGPAVILDGSKLADVTPGLSVYGNFAEIYGLHITGFRGCGVYVGPNAGRVVLGQPDFGNLIAGNRDIQVLAEGAGSVMLYDNLIGCDATGSKPHNGPFNGKGGVVLRNMRDTCFIGANDAEHGNVIAGNGGPGMVVEGGNTCYISYNSIGVTGSGDAVLPNTGPGVELRAGATQNYVVYNVIGGNIGPGIRLNMVDFNLIFANYIGVSDTNGTSLPNAGNGIELIDTCRMNIIGHPDYEEYANVIANHEGYGVWIASPSSSGNLIGVNRMFCNSADGIRLAEGAQGGIQSPRILSASSCGVAGKVNHPSDVLVQLYAAQEHQCSTCQGERFLGQVMSRNGIFNFPGEIENVGAVTAVAIDNVTFNTSAFAACQPFCSLKINMPTDTLVCNRSSFMLDGQVFVDSNQNVSYNWQKNGESVASKKDYVVVESGVYTLNVRGCNGNCNKTATIKVDLAPMLVDAGTDAYIDEGENVLLTPTVKQPDVTYTWKPAGDVNDSKTLSPTASPKQTTTFTLTITHRTCVAQDTVMVVVDKPYRTSWATPNGGAKAEVPTALAAGKDDIVYAVGSFSDAMKVGAQTLTAAGGEDLFIVAYTKAGSVAWIKGGGGMSLDKATAAATDVAGNLYVAGSFTDAMTLDGQTLTAVGAEDYFLAKYSANGSLAWIKGGGGMSLDRATAITTDADGNIYLAGEFTDAMTVDGLGVKAVGGQDIFVAKYDAAGAPVWIKGGGGMSLDRATAITVDKTGGLAVVGSFEEAMIFEGVKALAVGSEDFFVLQMNLQGANPRIKGGGGMSLDRATGIVAGDRGHLFVTGYFAGEAQLDALSMTSKGESDVFVARFNNNLDALWIKGGGGMSLDKATAITTDTEGALYISGVFSGTTELARKPLMSAGEEDFFVMKMSPMGLPMWIKGGGGMSLDRATAITSDASGNIVMTGSFEGTASFEQRTWNSTGESDMFVAKLLCRNCIDPVGRPDDLAPAAFLVYPNPTDDVLWLELDTPLRRPTQVEWRDLTGRIVASELLTLAHNEPYRLETRGLSAGVYVVSLPGYPPQKVLVR